VLDLETAVHDEVQVGVEHRPGSLRTPQAKLRPEEACPNGHRLVGHRRDVLQSTEHVNAIGYDRQVGQRGNARPAQDLVDRRVHEVDLEVGA